MSYQRVSSCFTVGKTQVYSLDSLVAIQLKNTVFFLVLYVCSWGLLSKIRQPFHGDCIYLCDENGRHFSLGEKVMFHSHIYYRPQLLGTLTDDFTAHDFSLYIFQSVYKG